MKPDANPLFPTSNNEGLQGAYEQAALMDDNIATFPAKTAKTTTPAHHNASSPSYKNFRATHRKIMQNYRQSLKKLKQQKRAGTISSDQFKQQKQALIKQTDSANSKNYKHFIIGD